MVAPVIAQPEHALLEIASIFHSFFTFRAENIITIRVVLSCEALRSLADDGEYQQSHCEGDTDDGDDVEHGMCMINNYFIRRSWSSRLSSGYIPRREHVLSSTLSHHIWRWRGESSLEAYLLCNHCFVLVFEFGRSSLSMSTRIG